MSRDFIVLPTNPQVVVVSPWKDSISYPRTENLGKIKGTVILRINLVKLRRTVLIPHLSFQGEGDQPRIQILLGIVAPPEVLRDSRKEFCFFASKPSGLPRHGGCRSAGWR